MLNKVAMIAPKQYMQEIGQENDFHLFLAHLVQSDDAYAELAKGSKGYKILDNSFFELGFSLPLNKLVGLADKIEANCIVLPDGLEGFNQKNRVLDETAYNIMLVPKTFEQLISFADFAVSNLRVYVGLSGIHAADMLKQHVGLNVRRFECMNRFLCLSQLMHHDKHLYKEFINSKRLHLLGLGDYPLLELKVFNLAGIEYTNDSSAYIMPFLVNNIRIDEITFKQNYAINYDYNIAEEAWQSYKVALKDILDSLNNYNLRGVSND